MNKTTPNTNLFLGLFIGFLLLVNVALISFYSGIQMKNGFTPSSVVFNGNKDEVIFNGLTYEKSILNLMASIPIGDVLTQLSVFQASQSHNVKEYSRTMIAEGVITKMDTSLAQKNIPYEFLVAIGSPDDLTTFFYSKKELPLVVVRELTKEKKTIPTTYRTLHVGDTVSIKETYSVKTGLLVKSEITVIK